MMLWNQDLEILAVNGHFCPRLCANAALDFRSSLRRCVFGSPMWFLGGVRSKSEIFSCLLSLLAGFTARSGERVRRRCGKGRIYQVRVPDRDARRQEAVHVSLLAKGPVQALSVAAVAHSLQRAALWHRPVPWVSGTIRSLSQSRVYFRLPGRAGPIPVGR